MYFADYIQKSAGAIASGRRAHAPGSRRSFMRRGAVTAVLAASVVLAAGCSSSSGSADEPGPSSSPTSTDADAWMHGAPQIGTCWNQPAKAFTPDHWFDDSPKVACTKPHTTETVDVFELADPTIRRAKETWNACWREAQAYLGSFMSRDHWVPWNPIVFLPPKQQVAAGASWARCDVELPREWADVIAPGGSDEDGIVQPSLRTFSAKDAATERADDLLPCLEREPQIADQPFVPCSRPHRYEATGQLAVLENLHSYPSANKLRGGSLQCRHDLPANQQADAFAVTAAWQPPGAFSGGYISQLLGVCFVYRQDGASLPPRG